MTTRHSTARRMRALQHLAGHFLDVVAGLTTLKIFGRSKAQVQTIREVTATYRRTTMATLRLAFLSSLVLELLASVAVALVAVSVGLRLLHGHLDLQHGALPPHPGAGGVPAAATRRHVLPRQRRRRPRRRAGVQRARRAGPVAGHPDRRTRPGASPAGGVRPGRDLPRPARARPRRGVVRRRAGRDRRHHRAERLREVDPALGGAWASSLRSEGRSASAASICDDLDPDAWRTHVAWVPQRPHLFAASIADNIRLGRHDADDAALQEAIEHAGLRDVVAGLPEGVGTVLGERGAGLSAGERQRVALARAFLRDAPLLLLDEPTAGLDGATEADVLAAVRRLAQGRTVLVVAHRPALVAMADRVVALGAGSMSAQPAATDASRASTGTPPPDVAHRSARRWTTGRRHAARRGGRGRRHRTARDVGVVDLARRRASLDRRPRPGRGGRALLRHLPWAVPLRRAPRRPRRRLPPARRPPGHRLPAARASRPFRPPGLPPWRPPRPSRGRRRHPPGPPAAGAPSLWHRPRRGGGDRRRHRVAAAGRRARPGRHPARRRCPRPMAHAPAGAADRGPPGDRPGRARRRRRRSRRRRTRPRGLRRHAPPAGTRGRGRCGADRRWRRPRPTPPASVRASTSCSPARRCGARWSSAWPRCTKAGCRACSSR